MGSVALCYFYDFLPSLFLYLTELSRKKITRFSLRIKIIMWCHIFWTSKKRSRNYDVNRRIFYSMRRIGNGYNCMKRFLVLMNHPPPMTEKNYRKLSTVFRNSVKHVAETVMKDAALDIHKQNHDVTIDNVVDTGVSVDGTWQKRGFTSLNGAVAAISIETGRVLDVEVMTSYCQGCINIAKFRENREMYVRLNIFILQRLYKKGMYRTCTKTGWYTAPKT